MGLLDRIGQRLRRRRRAAGRRGRAVSLVDPGFVEQALTLSDAVRPSPRSARVEFVLALLDVADLHRVPGWLDEVAAVARRCNAWVENLTGPLVFLTFGTLPGPPVSDATAARAECVRQLRERLHDEVRIVQGTGAGLIGDVGSPEPGGAYQYGSVLRGFGQMVRRLTELPPGGVSEWSES